MGNRTGVMLLVAAELMVNKPKPYNSAFMRRFLKTLGMNETVGI
jgi:hypothetical protein